MSRHIISTKEKIRTTIDMPHDLWERIRSAVKTSEAKSQNAFIVKALESYLKQLEQEWIDREFARMQDDDRYKALNLQIAEEFVHSDWETFKSNEKKT